MQKVGKQYQKLNFLSPSGCGATAQHRDPPRAVPHFYPRPPVRATASSRRGSAIVGISIHALRVRATLVLQARPAQASAFLSPSGWRATCQRIDGCCGVDISITPSGWRATCDQSKPTRMSKYSIALRVEGDLRLSATPPPFSNDFYPRPPGGGGRLLQHRIYLTTLLHFYPRHSGEGDRIGHFDRSPSANFYPRPPGGGRPSPTSPATAARNFYPRPPEGDAVRSRRDGGHYFHPRPPVEGDPPFTDNSFLD